MKLLTKSLSLLMLFSITLFVQSCNDDDNQLPVVEAGFTHTIDQNTGKVTFLNTSSSNADAFVWDLGDGESSTEINPIHFYGTGQYFVELTASNVSGAEDTFRDTININIPLPVTVPFNFDEANVVYNPTTFGGASFAIVDNPDPSGSNAAASQVGAITNIGASFEGLFFTLGSPLNLATDMTVTMDVWSDVALPVLLKLEQGTGVDTEVSVNHTGSGWEELVFTFTSADQFNQFTVFVDGPGASTGTFYIDNITQTATVDVVAPVITLNGDSTMNVIVGNTFTDPGATATDNVDGDISANIVVAGDTVDANTIGTYVITYNVMDAAGNAATEVTRTVNVTAAPTSPPSGAPVPTHPAADVVSIFSDTYTNITGVNYDPNWGQSGHTQVNTSFDPGDGNFALDYPNFNYQGTDFSGNQQDLSAMEFIHIDMWTLDATDVKFTPISAGTGEFLVNLTPITTGEWNSYDIPLSDFTGVSMNDIIQLKFDGQGGTNPSHIWLDNIYFYTTGGGGGGGGSCPTPPAGEFITDGDFEANMDCWELFNNGGTTSISTTVSNGGSNSGQIETTTGANPGLKQTRFGVGEVLPNTTYVVTFDIQASSPLLDGSVFNAFAFSEPADGSGLPAAQHVLVSGDASIAATWQPKSFTFTTAANVDGGISLLMELVCGGAATCTGTVNIDNVSLVAQ